MVDGAGVAVAPSPVAQTIDLLGDRLTVAVLRDAFVDHVRRFSQWIDRSGAPPAVLSSRLNALVDAGLMERRPQSGGHERHDYMLTDLGLATWEFLVSVWSWQREWSADGLLQPEMVHVDCGHRGPPELVCRHCGETVRPRDARLEMDRDSLGLVARGSRRRSTRNSPALSRADLQFTEVMEAIGDRWSALVTGLALSGVRRFGEFQSILKISPTTLTERLARLSDVQILARSEGGREYVLTPRGRALFPIFAFLLAWTLTAHPGVSPEQLGPKLRHDGCGNWLQPALRCRGCDVDLQRTSVIFES
ncbi:winged helix-turn-helix transcriptional regulator [Prescottella agglutinans]|uniref:DNA-binding HxlR family transcriptional regulator n=1 Tax=Prescottella agglutinans TaxID=1644129 RepID=A0ABT6MD68_9NOCA|nr:winged helix-turn-helix transcriptional regulator [Prescottella agglutinans]MDH6281825.1 DNA-binding HxlR family transcriptional regulator [Prescottella agglutinans]